MNTFGTLFRLTSFGESHGAAIGGVIIPEMKNQGYEPGYIGAYMGACGGIEAWTSIHMMRRGWFSPNLNLNNVDPACAPLDYITGNGREMDVEYIMSNNFAFGGVNTSLIFKKI